MKRWPIVAAGAAGAITGFLGTFYVGMAMGLATSLTATATVILVVICPPIMQSGGSGGSFRSLTPFSTVPSHSG